MDKIYISGTGRCGTTFLIKLFTFLKFNTGYTKESYTRSIIKNCNAGMEKRYNDNYHVLKNPDFINKIETIVSDKSIHIEAFIIPIRDYDASAKSRIKYGNQAGGLWNASDEKTQIEFYHSVMAKYIRHMVKHEIKTIFLDFDTMVKDKRYLFDKLNPILCKKGIEYVSFCHAYDEASSTSTPELKG
jgi:hypothetical protein